MNKMSLTPFPSAAQAFAVRGVLIRATEQIGRIKQLRTPWILTSPLSKTAFHNVICNCEVEEGVGSEENSQKVVFNNVPSVLD